MEKYFLNLKTYENAFFRVRFVISSFHVGAGLKTLDKNRTPLNLQYFVILNNTTKKMTTYWWKIKMR